VNNIFAMFGGHVFQQTISIDTRTNYAPPVCVADLSDRDVNGVHVNAWEDEPWLYVL
jgi:hypothetical protein